MTNFIRVIYIFILIGISYSSLEAKVYAMVIGVNDYTWQKNLRYATKDALLFKSTIAESNPYMDIEWVVLLDHHATIDNIVDYFVRYIQNIQEEDTFIFYFSGHGTEEGLYVSDGLRQSGHFPYDLLKTAIKHIAAKDKLIFIDACHSAAIVKKSLTQHKNNQLKGLSQSPKATKTKQNTILFLGSGVRETSLESGAVGHGLFTFFLCYGIAGAADFNDDKIVQIDELFYFFRNNTFVASKIVSPNYQCPLLVGNFDKKLIIADLNLRN